MNVRELIEELQELPQDLEIAILDGSNGGGHPREINYGPIVYDPKDWPNNKENADYGDIETNDGGVIVQMGYGCY